MSITDFEPQTTESFDPNLIFNEKFTLGTIDLVQGGTLRQIIAPVIAGSYFFRKKSNNERVLSEILLILPPENIPTLTTPEIYESLYESVAKITGEPTVEKAQEYIRKSVRIATCQSLQFVDLFNLISSAGNNALIIISSAELYRAKHISRPPKFGLTATHTREDDWVPHIAVLCQYCVKITKDIGSYALLHVSDGPAKSISNQNILCSIDDCYVFEFIDKGSPEEILVKNADRWLRMAVGAQLNQAIDEINNLTVSDLNKKLLTVQMFHRAKSKEELSKLLYELASQQDELESINKIQLAKIASDMECTDLANTFLSSNFDDLVSEAWLDTGLDVAIDLRNNQVIDLLDEKFESLFPESEALRDNRDKRLILNCHLLGKDDFLFTITGFTKHHLFLSKSLTRDEVDFNEIFEETQNWEEEWQGLAFLCCAIFAERDGDFIFAVECAARSAGSKLYCRQASQILLRLIRHLLLTEAISHDDYDFYVMPLEKVIRYLSLFPNDSSIRTQLISIFSVEVSGSAGMPLIIKLTLDQLSIGVRLHETEVNENSSTPIFNEEESQRLIETGLRWLSEQAVVEPGVTTLPVEMVDRNPDSVIKKLKNLIQMTSSIKGEDVDLHFMEQLVLLTCAITPFAQSERNTDIQALRHYACQLVINDQAQHARDLCEQALLLGKGSDFRKRLAWIMLADVYQRNHQPTIAFLSLACASAIDIKMSAAELCDEIYIALRLMRDFGGLGDLTVKTIQKLNELLVLAGIDPEKDARLIIANWSIRLRELHRIDPDELVNLASEISLKCSENLEDRSFLLSASVLLAQIIKRCDELSKPVHPTNRNMLTTAIDRIGDVNAQFVSVLSTDRPSPAMVVDLYNRVQHARYASDTPGDLRNVTSLARTLLNGNLFSSSTETIALAIELLAEQAIEYPVEPQNLITSWPITFAQAFSKNNIELLFLALNNLNELIVLYVSEHDVQLIEQPVKESSFFKRLQLWSRQYPREYGYIDIDAGSNDFFTSMEELEIVLPTIQNRVVVLAEPILHQLPLNLFLTSKDNEEFSSFIGENTAIGLAPSLTWLSLIQNRKRGSTKKHQAWIPDSQQGALNILLSRIQDTLEEFEFSLDTGSRLPKNFSGSSIAIIAAHGGLTVDGKFIHTIRDEDALVENPSALAYSLRDVELVILFVCSGGRLDKHPSDHTTVGLPKLLLNNGCRTIIASPWPLDVKVTYNWLSPFMEAWNAGQTALNATLIANKAVAQRLGSHPAYSLAMTVYGDVLLTKQ